MAESRPPVIGIFGHIDHGKSTLLDYIRKTNTTDKETGGITQHISAYEVAHRTSEGKEGRITFIDTPGHEAFRGIRTRGAGVADIAVLVVSAEDGVKPQTVEALNHILESKLPYLVAATKMDRPSANLDKVKQDLAGHNVLVEGYGGNVSIVAVSAKTGEGIDELLDTLTLIAEMEEFTADKDENGSGVIIESFLDPKKGITATGIIKNGTVSTGMFAATSGSTAPLRFLLDAEGENRDSLSFSSPVQIVGWDKMPEAGAEFKTFLKKDEAQTYAEETKSKMPEVEQAQNEEGVETLPVIVKADTGGSLEAISYELGKLKRERIVPRVVMSGIGTVSEGDIKSALSIPGSVIVGFNTKIDTQAAALAERSGIPVDVFSIIYELTQKISDLLAEREPRIEVEEVTGRAKVLKIFSATRDKQVIGCKVTEGSLEKGSSVKIIRRESEIGKGVVKELQQAKSSVNNVNEGTEFGTMIESKTEIAQNDVLEAVIKVTK